MKTGLFLECQKAHGRAVDWLVQLLPAKIKAFIEAESWAGHINPDTGKPFGSFYECAVTRIPHGLGFDGKDRRHTYAQVVSYCDLQRGDVAMMMRQQQPALAGHGEIGNGRSRDYNIMSTPAGAAGCLEQVDIVNLVAGRAAGRVGALPGWLQHHLIMLIRLRTAPVAPVGQPSVHHLGRPVGQQMGKWGGPAQPSSPAPYHFA